jgi:hypothetical protein
MPLPPKSYYGIEEIAEMWGTTSDDILIYAMDGLIELSVMLVGRQIATGEIVDGEKKEREVRRFNRPLPVYAEDLWPIMKGAGSTIGRFKTSEPNTYAEPANENRRWPVWASSVVITREEKDKFERAHKIATSSASAEQPVKGAFSHSADYTSVELSGYSFQLGALQAGIVRQLHAASVDGPGWIRGGILLEGVQSRSTYIGHLFKSQPNWLKLISSDGKGNYRLNIPGGGQEKKLFRRPWISLSSRAGPTAPVRFATKACAPLRTKRMAIPSQAQISKPTS